MEKLKNDIVKEIEELRDLMCPNALEDTTIDNRKLLFDDVVSEEDFRDWLSKQKKRDGSQLSEEYQIGYYYILKAIPSMLGYENVFNIKTVEEFGLYKKALIESDVYKELNPNLGSGTLSGALTKYENYLDERNLVSIPQDRLAEILKEWYTEKYVENNKTSTVVGFGFKYARAIDKANITSRALLNLAEIDSTLHSYIDRGKDLYEAIEKASIGIKIKFERNIFAKCTDNFDYSITEGEAINKIFYGVPGCGKSYHIEYNILGKDKDTKKFTGDYEKDNIIRTTFYQDYSNTDFVGQILPKITKNDKGEDVVEYSFNPGPFTKAFVQAVSNPKKKVALVVEEINRGNAPAIFGDIFQLLDRNENGISEYGIKNVSMMDYLDELTFIVDGEETHYIFNEIKIPGNLYIYATMNTSDQNVYTLDTAFTRRWGKERIPNKFGVQTIKDMLVPGLDNVKWEKFVNVINNTIRNKIDELQVNEDKQIGIFFVKESDLIDSANPIVDDKKTETFAYKVLEYLWDDVTKLDHSVIFKPSYKTFTQLMEDYIDHKFVFNNDVAKELGIIQSETTN